MAAILLLTEGSGYPPQGNAQTRRDKATQRNEERREGNLRALRSSALQICLGYEGSRMTRDKRMSSNLANHSHFPPFSLFPVTQLRLLQTGKVLHHLPFATGRTYHLPFATGVGLVPRPTLLLRASDQTARLTPAPVFPKFQPPVEAEFWPAGEFGHVVAHDLG